MSVPVAIQRLKNPTTLHRTRAVSQKVNMAARGGGHTTLSQTAPQTLRATLSQRAGPRGPSPSSPPQRPKTSLFERRNVWQM